MKDIRVSFPGGKRVDAAYDGMVVHTDQSVAHGGEGAAPEPFDLFFVDINMRMMDGLSFLRAARATPDLAGVPAVIVSSAKDEAEQARAFAAGANFFLTKPIDPALYVAVARRLCGLSPRPRVAGDRLAGRAA